MSFLLAEQNTNIALRYAEYGYILDIRPHRAGRRKPRHCAKTRHVKEFYLGVGGEGRRSFKSVKHYKRRKRWLS